ncbi:hypothetical protein TOPH_04109, partial [Tolypocladium ophioglossoides CBS 100239]
RPGTGALLAREPDDIRARDPEHGVRLNEDEAIHRQEAVRDQGLGLRELYKVIRSFLRTIPSSYVHILSPFQVVVERKSRVQEALLDGQNAVSGSGLKKCAQVWDRIRIRNAGLLEILPTNIRLDEPRAEYKEMWHHVNANVQLIHRMAHDFLVDAEEGKHDRYTPDDMSIQLAKSLLCQPLARGGPSFATDLLQVSGRCTRYTNPNEKGADGPGGHVPGLVDRARRQTRPQAKACRVKGIMKKAELEKLEKRLSQSLGLLQLALQMYQLALRHMANSVLQNINSDLLASSVASIVVKRLNEPDRHANETQREHGQSGTTQKAANPSAISRPEEYSTVCTSSKFGRFVRTCNRVTGAWKALIQPPESPYIPGTSGCSIGHGEQNRQLKQITDALGSFQRHPDAVPAERLLDLVQSRVAG